MSLKHFGTDGIRGAYGGPTLNDNIAYRAGRAACLVIKQGDPGAHPLIAVGRDTRASGKALCAAFAQGVVREGGTILDLGVAPTPCVAFAAARSDAQLGCVITASHNPAADNGIKFFQGDGMKPSVELEQALDDAITASDSADRDESSPIESTEASIWKERYLSAVIGHFSPDALSGLRVAIDCANGALFDLAPRAIAHLGAETVVIAASPDGANINAMAGSEHPESLQALYSYGKYDCSIAFDGDGDRAILFDEMGHRISGEAVMAVLALDAHQLGTLAANTLVTTEQSNLGLDVVLRERGIETRRVPVGDKHIVRLMESEGFRVGGEESGHLVLGDFAITGDGLLAGIKLAQIIRSSGQTASELASVYRAFPQRSTAIRVAEKRPLEECFALAECRQTLETTLGSSGRMLIRYSGTEPKLRLLVEAKDDEIVRSAMEALLAAAAKDLQVVD